jgi:hypothetical protein
VTAPFSPRLALPWLLAACIALTAGVPAVAAAASRAHGASAHAQQVKSSSKHKGGASAHGKKAKKHGHHKAKSGKSASHKAG